MLATVDEAHDYAMEAATPFVNQGFTVREDYWNGEVESGQQLAIRHQLFKGNEYAFWLGTANPDCELEVAVYDDKNQPVHMERKSDKHSCSVRVNPPEDRHLHRGLQRQKQEGTRRHLGAGVWVSVEMVLAFLVRGSGFLVRVRMTARWQPPCIAPGTPEP